MEYREFLEAFKMHLLEQKDQNVKEKDIYYYPKGYVGETEEDARFVMETNIMYHNIESSKLAGDYVVVRPGGASGKMQLRFDLRDYYELYCECDSWEKVDPFLEHQRKFCEKASEQFDPDSLNAFETIKDKLILRLVNYTDNRFSLERAVYKQYGDIAMVLYVLVSHTDEMGILTIKVPASCVKLWDVDLEEVFRTAMANTVVYAPARMYVDPLKVTNPKYTEGAFMSLESDMTLTPMSCPVLTTTVQINGATAMFYPGVMEKIAEMFNSNYEVCFTSTNDVRLHKTGTISRAEIASRLRMINNQINNPDQIVSREVFHYDRVKKELTVL